MRKPTIRPGDVFNGAKVVSYVNSFFVCIKFENTGNRKWVTAQALRKGNVSDKHAKAQQEAQAAVDRLEAKRKNLIDDLKALDARIAVASKAVRSPDAEYERKTEQAYNAVGVRPGIKPGALVLIGSDTTPKIVDEYTPGGLVWFTWPDGKPGKARPEIVKPYYP